ncbi:MAG: UvrB/UvrC motif-containing protein [Clostridioides sp.]|jgi:protein arginine kinase activator|nr:UvrB/UvrC motif-containing protein [Clostridioides sp.]
MLCQKCNKNNATIYYKENINGEEKEMYLCEECAKNHTPAMIDLFLPFSIGDIFTNKKLKKENIDDKAFKCPNCGMSYSEFEKTGKLGCCECYNTFREQLTPIIQKFQGNSEHIGKVPNNSYKKLSIRNQIKSLKKELSNEIEKENYENAAILRDKIKAMENDMNNEVK